MAREPARTAYDAEQRYIRIISRGLTCICKSFWIASTPLRGNPLQDRVLSLADGGGFGVRLRRDNEPPVFLTAIQVYQLVPDDRYEAGEWKAHTTQYIYTIAEQDDDRNVRPIIAWHWHPGSGGTDDPHVHVYAAGTICQRYLSKLHIPGERTAFEAIVRFLVDELGVTPNREDWKQLVDDAMEAFVRFRTWPRSQPIEQDQGP